MNEQQAFRAIRNAIRLENLSNELADKVNPELRAIFQELGQQFKAMPPGNIEREVWYRQVRAQIGSIFAPLSEEMRDAVTDALDKEAVEQMRYAEKYLSDGMRQEGLTVRAPQEGFSQLEFGNPQFTRQQLHTIAESSQVLGDRMGDLFRPNLDSGGKWGKWIEQNLSLVDRKVKAGFLTGMTNEQIAATLPGAGREAVVRNKAIARTAVMDMSARSQEALWAANSDRIKGWEMDATMDNRVCDVCAPWDGVTKEKRSQLPTTPLHINCRCRVLPLTATEMALRKEEGPQRRSVVELIEADSKEAAIAKAKLKPGVTEARAYARQVKVNGKKYWRIAEDIVRGDKPLTMGEFLQQASPVTQAQVLGSEKRRSEFLKLIRGTSSRPPISADRALKEVTEWRPTVTRRPRLSAQMKLDISKLKSQRDLMKELASGEGDAVVYGYLNKEGKPYYVGIGSDVTRPFGAHYRKVGNRQVDFRPSDPTRIRLMSGRKPISRQKALEIEQRLVSRYGRIGDGSGSLINRAPGGRATGPALPSSTKRVRDSAALLGLTPSEYMQMTRRQRKTALDKARRGLDWRVSGRAAPESASEKSARIAASAKTRLEKGARELGISVPDYQRMTRNERYEAKQWLAANPSKKLSDRAVLSRGEVGRVAGDRKLMSKAKELGLPFEDWAALDEKTRRSVLKRVSNGSSAKDALKGVQIGASQAQLDQARQWGVSIERYLQFSAAEKNKLRARYRLGKRGKALLEGLL